jgi:serine/threonine-protein kinase HipA
MERPYSLLLAGDQVRLAPLYEIASAIPYGMHERILRFAMKIGGDDRVFPQCNPWPGAARDLGLDAGALVGRLSELAGVAPDAFADAVSPPDIVALDRNLPGKLLDLVAVRAARCRTLLEPAASSTEPTT